MGINPRIWYLHRPVHLITEGSGKGVGLDVYDTI